jgi:hypothetical protein
MVPVFTTGWVCRLALDLNEVLVVVDLEDRLRHVDHAPNDDRGDLDRIAVVIVHPPAAGTASDSRMPNEPCAPGSWDPFEDHPSDISL